MNDGILGKGLAMLVAAAFVLSLVFAFLAELVTIMACGARPIADTVFAGLGLAINGDPSVYIAPNGCAIPVVAIRVVDLIALLVVAALIVLVVVSYRRYRASDRAFVNGLLARPGVRH